MAKWMMARSGGWFFWFDEYKLVYELTQLSLDIFEKKCGIIVIYNIVIYIIITGLQPPCLHLLFSSSFFKFDGTLARVAPMATHMCTRVQHVCQHAFRVPREDTHVTIHNSQTCEWLPSNKFKAKFHCLLSSISTAQHPLPWLHLTAQL